MPLARGMLMMSGTRVPPSKSEPAFDHLPFLAELVAVVGDEDDEGVVAELESFEFGNYAAEVPVGPGDGGKVGADDLLGFGLGCAAADEEVGVARADGGFGEAGRDGGPGGEVGRERDLVRVPEVEETLRALAAGCGAWRIRSRRRRAW